jgi:N-terminal domain of anti-restriction factor ArdC
MKRDKQQMQQEALSRAASGMVVTNYAAIFEGFAAKGIPESEIKPRENVFTFQAWKALGRYVRKGEHGVKVITYVPTSGKRSTRKPARKRPSEENAPGLRPCFHVSQTEPTATAERQVA